MEYMEEQMDAQIEASLHAEPEYSAMTWLVAFPLSDMSEFKESHVNLILPPEYSSMEEYKLDIESGKVTEMRIERVFIRIKKPGG